MERKKDTPYLDFYKKCMKDGERLPWWNKSDRCNGLCPAFWLYLHEELSVLKFYFEPPDIQEDDLTIFWASGDPESPRWGEFTPLRQTIVLFLAAMNDEL